MFTFTQLCFLVVVYIHSVMGVASNCRNWITQNN